MAYFPTLCFFLRHDRKRDRSFFYYFRKEDEVRSDRQDPMDMEMNEVCQMGGGEPGQSCCYQRMGACITLHKKDGTEKKGEMKNTPIVLY